MMRKNSGFTALELATTIAIVAVIAALAMPPYLRWNRTRRLEGALVNLTSDLEMAKMRAIAIGTAILSAPVIAIFENGARIFIGVEGGIVSMPAVATPDMYRYYWHQMF